MTARPPLPGPSLGPRVPRAGFLSRRRLLNLGAGGGAALILPGISRPARAALPAVAEQDAVIAFAHVGPITDQGWSWSHDQGMRAVQAAFPKLKTVYAESVPPSSEGARIFRQFVEQGANLLFDDSTSGEFLYQVAEDSPDTGFLEGGGHRASGNIGYYYVAHWYPTYVIGVAAGLLSKSGKLGFVGSFPVSSVYGSTNAFLMGARSVNPKATLNVICINSWFDPQGAAQAGTALIDSGCDFLFGVMDEAAYLQVAEKRGVWAAMWNTDIRRFGPSSYVSSVMLDWRHFYIEQVRARLAGTWSPSGILLPMGGGVDRDAWGEKVPQEVRRTADAARDKILAGWSPFTGELYDTKGALRVKSGERMSEIALYNWEWSIAGVSGLTR